MTSFKEQVRAVNMFIMSLTFVVKIEQWLLWYQYAS